MNETNLSTYHVLLVGIDRYPLRYNSLSGCVNDIDAIEELLLAPPGIGFSAEQIRITRLAASHPDHKSYTRYHTETQFPTKLNLIRALKELAGPAVQPIDRVLIYYSGHGDEKLWTGSSSVWHEALVPHNNEEIEYLFDVEINTLINAISVKTDDLTVILDCCHSAGATRENEMKGKIRALNSEDKFVKPPDLSANGLDGGKEQEGLLGNHLLQSPKPNYIVIAACQSNETASEGLFIRGQSVHGVFTQSLLSVLREKDALQRNGLTWADIWPDLLAYVAYYNARLNHRAQNPRIVGRCERKVFGGEWVKADSGYRLRKRSDGSVQVDAGSLMSVSEGAKIAVYGPEPRLFQPIGSRADNPVGFLKVIRSGSSSSIAHPVGTSFPIPDGARGRLVYPGKSPKLKVSLKIENNTLKSCLEESPLLEIIPDTDSEPDVVISTKAEGKWVISTETEPLLAVVPIGEVIALRTGLESYYSYNVVLQMTRNCSDPQLRDTLNVLLLNCNDEETLKAMLPKELADPNLQIISHDRNKIYVLDQDYKFCVKVTNNSMYNFNVALLNCSAGGLVEFFGDVLLKTGATSIIWLDGVLGKPFTAGLDELPADKSGIILQNYSNDRLIAIGTTRLGISLDYLRVDQTVQEVVNESLSKKPLRTRGELQKAPAEIWTATVVNIRIIRPS
jgi:hypothetical protein